MEIGVLFPQNDLGADPVAIRDFAQAAEDLGYDWFMAGDHILGKDQAHAPRPGAYTIEYMWHEPFVLFSYLASLTSRIGFMTNVLVLGQRPAVLVAKQAAQLDFLSGGRLRLGVGVGWQKLEYDALGQEFETRGRRLAEQIVLMRKLWTESLVTFKGRYHQVDDGGLVGPPPVQRPIPVWIGGMAEPVLKRAARIADGWIVGFIPGAPQVPESFKPQWEFVQNELAASGRDAKTFGMQGAINMRDGGPEDWQMRLEAWREAGATSLTLGPPGPTATYQGQIDAIRRFKEAIG